MDHVQHLVRLPVFVEPEHNLQKKTVIDLFLNRLSESTCPKMMQQTGFAVVGVPSLRGTGTQPGESESH